ncbi:MAG: hypothetical protein CBB76_08475 [Crocinitomicaceae bacterium TMED16]|nr:MAG: hypothetical protein CBB76_08475 [Crocinitomicaceae bacterium TMED16]
MRKAFVHILILFVFNASFSLIGQRYYSLKEALNVPKDSVFYLKVSRKKLTEIPPEVFIFKNLKGLDLSKNLLVNISPKIAELSALEKLNLSKNRFEFFPKETSSLENLRVLILGGNKLGYIPLSISKHPKLEELDMYDNPIGDLGEGIFSVPTLRRLDLRGLMYNAKSQAEIRKKLPNVKVLFDPPCNCMD